jgi:hypothetical protein
MANKTRLTAQIAFCVSEQTFADLQKVHGRLCGENGLLVPLAATARVCFVHGMGEIAHKYMDAETRKTKPTGGGTAHKKKGKQ